MTDEKDQTGPKVDRFLMRIKDAIIIGGATFAIIKWIYVKPIQIQDQVNRNEQIQIKQQQTLEKIAANVEQQTEKLKDLNRAFSEFQRSFYSKKPGGWVYEDDRWKWSQQHDKTR